MTTTDNYPDDLLGWDNEATRDLWDYLVSYRENKPLCGKIYEASKRGYRETIIRMVAESMANHAGQDITMATASLATVNWDSICREIDDLGPNGIHGKD